MADKSLKIIEITKNDSMRVIVDKLNRMLKVVQEGVAVKFNERFTANLGEQEFNLKVPYSPGRQTMDVYVNGVKQRSAIDYQETNDTTITFFEPLLDGDAVVMEWLIPNGDVLLGRVDLDSIVSLPDGSIPYEKLSLPNEIITGDIDGGMFTDPRFETGIDAGNYSAPTESSIDGGALR